MTLSGFVKLLFQSIKAIYKHINQQIHLFCSIRALLILLISLIAIAINLFKDMKQADISAIFLNRIKYF